MARMSRWWRLYDEVLDDPKVQRLPCKTFKFWVNLLCVCSMSGGSLPPVIDIAFRLKIRANEVRTLLGRLRDAGLIDEDEQGLRPHNWNGRQFPSDVSRERMKRFRERHRDVTRDNAVTPQIQIQNTDKKKDAPNGASSDVTSGNGSDQERELFQRGREVLGKNAGGLIKNLLKAKGGKINEARAAIETASGKANPREYIGAINNKPKAKPHDPYEGIV